MTITLESLHERLAAAEARVAQLVEHRETTVPPFVTAGQALEVVLSKFAPRWLNSEQTAAHVSRRVDELPRLLRVGKLPSPSLHFGPRSPRWDRVKLDAMMMRGGTGSTNAPDLV